MRKVRLIAVGVLVLVVAILGALILAPRFYNDWLLYRFEKSVKHLPLNIMETETRIGILWGCSNHCDMEVMAVSNSVLNPVDFYARVQSLIPDIRNPFDGSCHPWVLLYDQGQLSLFSKNGGGLFPVSEDGHVEVEEFFELDHHGKELLAQIQKTTGLNQNHYVLICCDQTYGGFSMGDFRAH